MRMRFVLAGLIAAAAMQAMPAHAECTITGPYTISCDSVTLRAVDDECVYYVDLAAHSAAHPGVPLPTPKRTIATCYADAAVIQPVLVQLTDYVDCLQTDHGFTDATIWSGYGPTNPPSRIMHISGKDFRVTGAPVGGFDTSYYSYDVATGGTAGTPHVLIAELSNDRERYTTLNIHFPDSIVINPGLPWAPPYTGEPTYNPWGDPWYNVNFPKAEQGCVFGPDVAVTTYTGRELPIDDLPFLTSLIFHPKTAVARVVVSALGATLTRTSFDGGAVSQFWVFEMLDAMPDRNPVIAEPTVPAERRLLGMHMTHPWYFYAHYGEPVRLLSQRQAGLRRLMRDLRFCGFNYLAFNAVNGADRSVKTWYSGSAHFSWNSAGNLLTELPPIAEQEGVQVVPLITSLARPASTAGLTFSDDSLQRSKDGDFIRAFGQETLDPLRPEIQQYMFNLLNEIASRCASSPAVRGIGIRVNGKIGTCYTADQDGLRGAMQAGYSAWDLQQFKNDTLSGVPTSPPRTAYDWLRARPTEWESWINWRCQRTRQFWLACRDLIQSYRPDLIFYVQCDLPSETPGTNIEWTQGETPRNLLRHHGYDPEMFANDTGIVIVRGMMVAQDRFYASGRWGAPWGSNYVNYRLFHYATGLAEMYRTAEGRACDMYQAYWEEVSNPYFEFGSPGDPNGYFRTSTPAAPGRAFFAPAIMSIRRQDPDTITWLGWNRPILGHENELRKFAQAFRSLPATDAVAIDGTIEPAMSGVEARWHGNRLAVINDTSAARTVQLHFTDPFPTGQTLTDVVSGRAVLTGSQTDRRNVTVDVEAYGLVTLLYTGEPPPPPPPPPPVPGVDNPSFEDLGGSYEGWEIVHVYGEGPDVPPLTNTNPWGLTTPYGTHFGGKITNGLRLDFYLGQVVGTTDWNADSTHADWSLSTHVQLNCSHNNVPTPLGVHQVWQIGWNDDGSEPTSIMSCDHYETVANITGEYTGNDIAGFYPLTAGGAIDGVRGLRGVAVRVHMFNDASYWWSLVNTDNLAFTVTAMPPPENGDVDSDGDVDLSDFGFFQICFNGPNRPPMLNSSCDVVDFDKDDDVDLADFAEFLACFNGANRPPACP